MRAEHLVKHGVVRAIDFVPSIHVPRVQERVNALSQQRGLVRSRVSSQDLIALERSSRAARGFGLGVGNPFVVYVVGVAASTRDVIRGNKQLEHMILRFEALCEGGWCREQVHRRNSLGRSQWGKSR
jgi:hypothetical protein